MSNILSELLNSHFTKLGIDQDNKDLKSLLSDPRLSEIQVPDTLSEALNKDFLTEDTAKNDPRVAGHFKVKHYKTLDWHIKKELKNRGLSEDIIAEIESEPDTIKKLGMALPKLEDHIKSSFKPSDDGGAKYKELADKYNKEIEEKQSLIQAFEQEKKNIYSQIESEKINSEISSHISSYQFSDTLDSNDIKFLINKKLQDSPYTFKKTDNGVGVFQKENPDLIATKNNKPLSIKDLLDEIAAPYVKKTTNTTGNVKKPIVTSTGTQTNNAYVFGNQHLNKVKQDLERAKSKIAGA